MPDEEKLLNNTLQFDYLLCMQGLLGGKFVSNAGVYCNEKEAPLQRAISVILPFTLTAILNKARTSQISTFIQYANSKDVLADIDDVPGNAQRVIYDRDVVNAIFNGQLKTISTSLSLYATVQPATIITLLSIIVPAALQLLEDYVNSDEMRLREIISQKTKILESLPYQREISKEGLVERPESLRLLMHPHIQWVLLAIILILFILVSIFIVYKYPI